jgi:hypothetical protein
MAGIVMGATEMDGYMSERTFNFVLNDEKRLTMLYALGFMFHHVADAPAGVKEPVVQLINELTVAGGKEPAVENSGTEATKAPSSSGAVDYFAVDRKGNVPRKPPDGAELQSVRIVSAVPKGKYLQVIFGSSEPGEKITKTLGGKANCFDESLWPRIKQAQGQKLGLWILESGNYLNIVGVRA